WLLPVLGVGAHPPNAVCHDEVRARQLSSRRRFANELGPRGRSGMRPRSSPALIGICGIVGLLDAAATDGQPIVVGRVALSAGYPRPGWGTPWRTQSLSLSCTARDHEHRGKC